VDIFYGQALIPSTTSLKNCADTIQEQIISHKQSWSWWKRIEAESNV